MHTHQGQVVRAGGGPAPLLVDDGDGGGVLQHHPDGSVGEGCSVVDCDISEPATHKLHFVKIVGLEPLEGVDHHLWAESKFDEGFRGIGGMINRLPQVGHLLVGGW